LEGDLILLEPKPEFGEIAQEVVTHLAVADLVVAHNASFDPRVLHALLEHFHIPVPPLQHQCHPGTLPPNLVRPPNHQLSTLAMHIGCDLNHDHAQSDAISAGKLMQAVMSLWNVIRREKCYM
jgi:DNA polymerase-3 subunit epsilon